MGMDLAFLAKSQNQHLIGGNDISDVDKENIDIGNVNAGKAIASILAMSALEAHNAHMAVVTARNGVSDPRATRNLMKYPTIDLSSLREYADTAPNIAFPGGGEVMGAFDREIISLSNLLWLHPHQATKVLFQWGHRPHIPSLLPPNVVTPTVITVMTLQSLGPFDPAPGLAMKKTPPTYPAKKKGPTYKTPKSVALEFFNSVSATMYGTQVRMPSASLHTDANGLMIGGKRDDIIHINDDNNSVVSTLPFIQKPICPKKRKATPRTALIRSARNTAISRASTPILNDVANFFSLPMAPLRDMAGYVLETKKNTNPEDL
eukprot:jgi/Psemu1/14791/gm1.14791_g